MATVAELKAESGQPVVPLDRQFLIHELNLFEEPKGNTVPLLYGILAHFLHESKDGIRNAFLKGSSPQLPSPNFSRQQSRRKQIEDLLGTGTEKHGGVQDLPVPQAVRR
ncbi:centrosomal protein 20 isoform X3 [Echinops telfairi]|uniref:Centrosomal protein 20 isoform X3 n=1 Tax=Echinops telfairi TaxID=9371 RepID=A0AC55CP36_ECHTE|nr:centrosomal protein 20 isoform X3 [Echinops telfairi]